MDKLNELQRGEASKRLEILGYDKQVCSKYSDKSFMLKLQEAENSQVPDKIDITPFLKMEQQENIFTYLYRYSVTEDNKLKLRMFFVNDKPESWEEDRKVLKQALTSSVDSDEAKNIFKTFVKPL